MVTDTTARIRERILQEQGASGLVRADYYSTRAQGVAATPVGNYFSSTETGTLRIYQRTAAAPYYVDQGDAAAPVSRGEITQLTRRFASGRWYMGEGIGAITNTGAAPGANNLRGYCARVAGYVSVTNLGIRVTTASSGGKARAAIYAADPMKMGPIGAPLITTGDLSVNTTGTTSLAGSTVILTPGYYYFFAQLDNAAAVLTSVASSSGAATALSGSNTLGSAFINAGVGKANPGAYGTWPTFTGDLDADGFGVRTTTDVPVVIFQAD